MSNHVKGKKLCFLFSTFATTFINHNLNIENIQFISHTKPKPNQNNEGKKKVRL